MKSALTYGSVYPGVLSSVPSGCQCIVDVGRGTGVVFVGASNAAHPEQFGAWPSLSACASAGGFAGSCFLGPVVPLLDAICLRLAPALLGTQFVLVATPG